MVTNINCLIGSGWVKDFFIPLASVFLGAWLAFLFERRSRKEEREERYRSLLRLLRGDFEKAKSFVGETIEGLTRLEKEPSVTGPVLLYQLPTTYFSSIDFVGLASYVSENCIEHIRNITEYVFPRWNESLGPALRNDHLSKEDKTVAIRALASQTISACDVVIKAINDELRHKAVS